MKMLLNLSLNYFSINNEDFRIVKTLFTLMLLLEQARGR